MLQSSLPWPSSFQVFLWPTAGFSTPSASVLPALALKLSSLSVGRSWVLNFLSILAGKTWMLQSSLPWRSSFQVFLWATAASLTPLASWPGQPESCNPAARPGPQAFKFSCGPPALALKLSNFAVGHSCFITSLRILARTAWKLQSSPVAPLASWPGQPGCCNPPCPGPQVFKFLCGPQLLHQLP